MAAIDLDHALRIAEAACDRARAEILPRFRRVAVEEKRDGSPVTEADRAAERALREHLRAATPGFAVLGEEYGAEGAGAEGPTWVVDPIDGTRGFARGIPLFATLVALLVDGEPLLGVIDLPALGERIRGARGRGAWRGRERLRVSGETDLRRALVSHGDPFCFDLAGRREAFARMAAELPLLRGYTDAFGHALVIAGSVDAMVDLSLSPWDVAATECLVPEAGGRVERLTGLADGKLGLVLGAPALVEQLLELL